MPKLYDELQITPQKSIEKILITSKTPTELFPELQITPKKSSYCTPNRHRHLRTIVDPM